MTIMQILYERISIFVLSVISNSLQSKKVLNKSNESKIKSISIATRYK